jgi:tRNA pseudouridine38-40 synthase
MPRYFIEVSYKGTNYAGFQVQKNANTIQAEVEKALSIYYRKTFDLTGSSRTDAGVHADQNFFHLDVAIHFSQPSRDVYHLNAILPADIVIKNIYEVKEDSHSRFDALFRRYEYRIYEKKNPFIADFSFFYPLPLDIDLLNNAAEVLLHVTDFSSFAKRNTQVKTFTCKLQKSEWRKDENELIYQVCGDRFLRGMVRGLVGTMLRVGARKISVEQFISIVESRNSGKADFSVPAHGLFLREVAYDKSIFIDP